MSLLECRLIFDMAGGSRSSWAVAAKAYTVEKSSAVLARFDLRSWYSMLQFLKPAYSRCCASELIGASTSLTRALHGTCGVSGRRTCETALRAVAAAQQA